MTNSHSPFRFASTGYGNAVCVQRVVALILPDSAPGKRRLKLARVSDAYIDMTVGHGVSSLLVLDTGQVAGCCIKPKTMLARLNAGETEEGALPHE